jgi:hypothetical protein
MQGLSGINQASKGRTPVDNSSQTGYQQQNFGPLFGLSNRSECRKRNVEKDRQEALGHLHHGFQTHRCDWHSDGSAGLDPG